MRSVTLTTTVLLLTCALPACTVYDHDFTWMTLRVDFYHAGTAAEEHLMLDRARVEGPWPGSRTQLLDPTNLGEYLVEVADRETGRLLYTRGFCSIYGEWETIGEALAGTWRCFPEAVRIPEPRRPIQLRILKRDAQQDFQEIWSVTIDPVSRHVERAPLPDGDVWTIWEHGAPSVKVDLLVLGDGYAANEREKFRGDAERLAAALFEAEPFASRKSDFNVRAVSTPAERSGVTRPRSGIFRNSPLGVSCSVFDLQRYALTYDDRAWRDAAAAAPYDFVLILANESVYAGGGILNLYALVAADTPLAPFIAAHEFGHHFAGLGDEYYAADVAYEAVVSQRVEPWEPNITALLDPTRLKWRELVEPGTPLPTPWGKGTFEHRYEEYQESLKAPPGGSGSEADAEARREQQTGHIRVLHEHEYAGKVGAFEGASYQVKGLYRPSVNCTMFVGRDVGFCPVCRRAIERVIDLYTR